MTVQERIRLARMMEMMRERDMKEEDGTYRFRDEKGEVLVALKMVEKDES